MVTLDIARTDAQFSQCIELLKKTHPDAPLPDFGAVNNTTFITWDSAEPETVTGVIHVELAPEVTHMAMDPGYRFQEAGYTLLHQFAEGNLRIAGHKRCFHSVPKDKARTIKMLKKSGAVEVGENEARLRRDL